MIKKTLILITISLCSVFSCIAQPEHGNGGSVGNGKIKMDSMTAKTATPKNHKSKRKNQKSSDHNLVLENKENQKSTIPVKPKK